MKKDLPLIVMSCSQVKKPTAEPVPFVDLYNGPTWQQVRKSGYPTTHVAVLSAEHGILFPGEKILPYDRRMTEARLVELANDPEQVARFVELCKGYSQVIVFGGCEYEQFALKLAIEHPEIFDRVEYVMGTYLQQRGALTTFFNAWTSGSDLANWSTVNQVPDEQLTPEMVRLTELHKRGDKMNKAERAEYDAILAAICEREGIVITNQPR
jgi:hypothetical protein